GFVNLECCLSTTGSPVAGKEFCFRGPPESAAGLFSAGVDVVSLANNHSKDYGTAALVETFSNLRANGVKWCGAGNNSAEAFAPAIVDVRGQKIAFLAFNGIVPSGWPATASEPGCATTWDRGRVSETIAAADSTSDYVVASFHWGVELDTSPNVSEMELAHLAVDSGADLVLGHHPHVVQGFELYKDRLIAYSLGNYIFGPPREISAKTLTLVVLLTPEGLVQAKLVPMHISSCRPVQMTGGPAQAWIDAVAGYSRQLGTEVSFRGGYGFIEGERKDWCRVFTRHQRR
ncbi:MAG: CapA family protein, partial [Actinobacteria bacterium]|nr:CapA family protein [Actinomycetota bacterium]